MVLRQSRNEAIVVGTLKSINIKNGFYKGQDTITVSVIVETRINDKINYARVFFYAKKSHRLFNTYEDYIQLKTIEKDGAENADRVKIVGELIMGEYTFDGNYKEFDNLICGFYMDRIDYFAKDEYGANIQCIIDKITNEISSTGELTGRKIVNLLGVGYNKVSEFHKIYVEKELANEFEQRYKENDTTMLYLRIFNYAESEEERYKCKSGFGEILKKPTTFTKYYRYINIIGGEDPYKYNLYSEEEIDFIKNIRNMRSIRKDYYEQLMFL